MTPFYTEKLRMLDILMLDEVGAAGVLGHSSPDPAAVERPELKRLEFFRCLSAIELPIVQEILRPSQESGTLQSVHLTGKLMEPFDELGATGAGNALFTDKSSITSLGLHDFGWQDAFSYHSTLTGRPFLEWVERFPNLTTVAAYPEHFEGAGSVVRALVAQGRFETVYQNCLIGVERDLVLEEARKHGTAVVHTATSYMPSPWPWVG